MIQTKHELREILDYEQNIFLNTYGKGTYQTFLRIVKQSPEYYTWKYIKALRKAGYYYSVRNKNPFYSLAYFLTCRKKNKLGRLLGIEMHECLCGKGLAIYHSNGIVINGFSQIGDNFVLHGNNCVGNDGILLDKCPIIGNNVRLGMGAKVLGDVHLGNNVIVAAGAVVVDSFEEDYIVLAGIPAKIVKYIANKETL
jgi:serine O-acetyltransferase